MEENNILKVSFHPQAAPRIDHTYSIIINGNRERVALLDEDVIKTN
jgi:hypothetical protein